MNTQNLDRVTIKGGNMVDPATYTNNDMMIVPARCQAIHPPSQRLFLHEKHALEIALQLLTDTK